MMLNTRTKITSEWTVYKDGSPLKTFTNYFEAMDYMFGLRHQYGERITFTKREISETIWCHNGYDL